MKENNKANRLTAALSGIYLLTLIWIIVFKFSTPFIADTRTINLLPFRLSFTLSGEVLMNVAIFVPLGIYAGALFQRWGIGKKLLFVALISFLCETLQYILGVGVSDITDLMTNTFGGFIGLMIYKGIEKAFRDSGKAQRFINIIMTAGTVVMIALLVLLVTGNLGIRLKYR